MSSTVVYTISRVYTPEVPGFFSSCRKYLGYVWRHKVSVYREARLLGVGFWQALIHDWTKFLPDEFLPYMNHFNRGLTGVGYEGFDRAYDLAWLKHIHRNKHHWQHWILQTDTEGVKTIRIPERYVREMIADWRGVGVALGKGRDNATKWYQENKDTLSLHPDTRSRVEVLLGISPGSPYLQTVPPPTPRKSGT